MKRTVLISGMGIAGPNAAYWLARRGWTVTLVERAPSDVEGAFARYEAWLAGMMREKQRAAAKFGKWFAPRTRIGLAVRNLSSRMLSLPLVGNALARGMLKDSVAVPVYA